MAAFIAPIVLVLIAAVVLVVHASDPDITVDFIVPVGVTPDANFFTYRGMRHSLWVTRNDSRFVPTKATQLEFPALQGQSVSLALPVYGPGAINPLHTHPRSSELLLVLKGCLEVGLVTSDGKLLVQNLYAGDIFVFPKGLVHYQVNRDTSNTVVAVAAFGSADAGRISLPNTLFNSGISTDVLAKSFHVGARTIELLQWPTTPN